MPALKNSTVKTVIMVTFREHKSAEEEIKVCVMNQVKDDTLFIRYCDRTGECQIAKCSL